MKQLELKNVKGCNDFGGEDEIIRNYISDTLRKNFEKYGYRPLSTSMLCYYDLLSLKYNEDNDILKEIYKVTDQANRNLALRYDLTVPFAKYISLNRNINLPYKRYEIGKVYRDGPVKQGRAREFIQCDVDCVGVEGQMVEAELITLFVDGFKDLGIDIIIKYNNRKIMTGIIEQCEIPESKITETITIVDKFEKLNKQEITQEFLNIGLIIEQIDSLIRYLNMNFEQIKEEFKETGNIALKVGVNTVKVVVKAANGDTRTYTINVVRSEAEKPTEPDTTTQEQTTTEKPTTVSEPKYSTTYTIVDGTYLTGIAVGTEINQVKESFELNNCTIQICNSNGRTESAGSVKTGMSVKVQNEAGQTVKQYICVIYGDINGDGEINIVDMLYQKRHILGIIHLTEANLLAGDINKSGTIDLVDMLYVKRHILGIGIISQ